MIWPKQRTLPRFICIISNMALEVGELFFCNMKTVCGVLTPLLLIRDLFSSFYKCFDDYKCLALPLFIFFCLRAPYKYVGTNEAPGR